MEAYIFISDWPLGIFKIHVAINSQGLVFEACIRGVYLAKCSEYKTSRVKPEAQLQGKTEREGQQFAYKILRNLAIRQKIVYTHVPTCIL